MTPILVAGLAFILGNVGLFVWALWLDHRAAVRERQMAGRALYAAGARPLTPGTYARLSPTDADMAQYTVDPEQDR